MLFLYHNLSLLPKSGNPSHAWCVYILETLSHQKELCTCSLAWLGKGWLSLQVGAQALSFRCADNTFFLLQASSSALSCTLSCKCIFPSPGLDCSLTSDSSHILVCPVGRLGNFAAPYCFCLHKWNFSWFPLGHVSGWHGFCLFFFFSPWDKMFGCLAGLEKVGASSLLLVGLETSPPLSLTVPPSCLVRSFNFSVEIPLFEEHGLEFAPLR